MATGRTSPLDYPRDWHRKLGEAGWWHSFELPDGTRIEGVCDLEGLKNRLAQFPIPADLHGQRVLDIGAWDGWFSFEMERRGAEVVAIDNWDNPRFHEMREMLGSRVDYRQMDVYQATPDRLGRFDIVLFMGVLYHLKHPLLALERVCALTTDLAAVDSLVLREHHRPGDSVEARPVMEFYETDELGGQLDNWVGPSLPCLLALCRTAGFARVEFRALLEHSACVACYRRWEPPPEAAAAPQLLGAVHHTNFGINFDSRSDDYLACHFTWPASHLSRHDVRPEVDGYGVQPVWVGRVAGGVWQANFKLPPGLAPGWHEVRLRTSESRFSNVLRIAVDLPPETAALAICGVRDALTFEAGEVRLRPASFVSLWVSGLPDNADRHNVRVELGGRRQTVEHVVGPEPGGLRQINIRLGPGIGPGAYDMTVRCGEAASLPVRLTVTLGGSAP